MKKNTILEIFLIYGNWFLYSVLFLIHSFHVCSVQITGGTLSLLAVGKRTNLLPWCAPLQHSRTSINKSQFGKGGKYSSSGKCWHEQSKKDSILSWILQHPCWENGWKGKISSFSWSVLLLRLTLPEGWYVIMERVWHWELGNMGA